MDVKEETQDKIKPDKNVLDLFWHLCDQDTNVRLKTCFAILHFLWKKQQEVENENELSNDLQYCVDRLLKGLASSREAARLGYTLLLTDILKQFHAVKVEEVLELVKKHLAITKQDKRDLVFGQLFAYTALIRSGRLTNHSCLPHVIISLYELSIGKQYILNATHEIILIVFSELTDENFKEVWSQLKKKLPSGWEACTADTLWLLLLCIRLFPDAIKAKYLKNHWKTDDIFDAENINHFKILIKQTTSTLPNLHPLCVEFVELIKKRKNFGDIWNAVVDGNLFDFEQSEKSYIGFEMIKIALQNSPTKKILKIVLSPKFQNVFSRSFLSAKHLMNQAACRLADFLSNFVKNNPVPDMQIIILKTFLHASGTVVIDEILKKKQVSTIIENLQPDAVKALCEILKGMFLKNKANDNNDKLNVMKRAQAVHQIASLIAHPVMLADIEWRLSVIQFLFLHSFFVVKEVTSEIPHCEVIFEPLPDSLRDSCICEFYRSLNNLHIKSETQAQPLKSFLELSSSLFDYAETLLSSPENLEPQFSFEKIQHSWNHLKSILQKLNKQSKKDGLVNESNAFETLFLQLGFHLFQDSEYISELLEELYICCKKSLKSRKHSSDENEDEEGDPPWIGVVVDIFLSLMSKSSKNLRNLVTQIFPLFSTFIDSNSLHQILDVINPQKNEDMLVDESDNEGDANEDADFGSGSSSDEESEEETDNQPVDDKFKKKVQEALGPAAEASDAESVVLSDSEMFKLDSALAEAFKGRVKPKRSEMESEEKSLVHFRARCLDLILVYLRSEPPMEMVLMCIEPVLAALEFGHHSKNQRPLLDKAVSVLKLMMKIKKFKHHDNVSKSELERLLECLIPKCHKEIDMTISNQLSSLCVFIVLCYRKLENSVSSSKKQHSKVSSYLKIYFSALENFATNGSSHMLPYFFTHLMEVCPDLAWYFIEPCKSYAFSENVRLFKRTQCLGLLSECLKYTKSQKNITSDQWLELAKDLFPIVIESLKNALESPEVKQTYCTEHLNIIHTLFMIINEKTSQSKFQISENSADLLSLLTNSADELGQRGKQLRNKIITWLGGNVNKSKKIQESNDDVILDKQPKKKKKSKVTEIILTDSGTEDLSSQNKKKKSKSKKKKKKKPSVILNNSGENESEKSN